MTLAEAIAAALVEHQPRPEFDSDSTECKCGTDFRIVDKGPKPYEEYDEECLYFPERQAAHQADVVMHIVLNWPAL